MEIVIGLVLGGALVLSFLFGCWFASATRESPEVRVREGQAVKLLGGDFLRVEVEDGGKLEIGQGAQVTMLDCRGEIIAGYEDIVHVEIPEEVAKELRSITEGI